MEVQPIPIEPASQPVENTIVEQQPTQDSQTEPVEDSDVGNNVDILA